LKPERIATGVPGLDDLIEGGLIRGDIHILAGAPGVGKTNLASSFVHNAVSKSKQKAVYATFEESSEYLKQNLSKLGIRFGQLEANGGLKLLDLDALRGKELESNIQLLLSAVKETGSTLLVIDSLTALLLASDSPFELRTFMKTMYRTLKEEKITAFMTLNHSISAGFGIEGFVADSVMLLENWLSSDQYKTRFIILKMRGTEHSRRYHSVIFSPAIAISKY